MTRVIHWVTAALLVLAFGAAWLFEATSPGAVASKLVDAHRSIGLAILAATALRLAWRVARPLPPLPVRTASWERGLAALVQGLLYLCLIAMPLLGWFGSGAQGDGVAFLGLLPLPALTEPNQDLGDRVFALHTTLGYAILGLLALHVAGALRHHFVKRDEVLSSMLLGAGRGEGRLMGSNPFRRQATRAADRAD